MKKPTDMENAVYKAMCDFYDTHGFMPTARELGEQLGLAPSGIPEYQRRLEARGKIERFPGLSPRIRILTRE